MAAVVHIGGFEAGLQEFMQNGHAVRQGKETAGHGPRSFAMQLQAMQARARRQVGTDATALKGSLASASAKGIPLSASEKLAAKTGGVKKALEEGSDKPQAATAKGADSAVLGAAEGAAGCLAMVPQPVVHAGTAAMIEGARMSVGLTSGGKLPASRGREGKVAPVAVSVLAAEVGDGKASAEILGPAHGASGAVVAGAFAPGANGGVMGTAGIATGALSMVPGAETAMGSASGRAGVLSHGPVGAAAHEAGEELEAGGASASSLSAPTMLVTTPHVLEVGITGGAHGWLRVRAELEHTGEVTASLVASSAASADALHKDLGAMSAYLKSEVVGVSSLAVTAMEKSRATQGFTSQANAGGTGAGAGRGAGGGSAKHDGGENTKASSWPGFGSGYGGQAVPAAVLDAGVGGWLNVRV